MGKWDRMLHVYMGILERETAKSLMRRLKNGKTLTMGVMRQALMDCGYRQDLVARTVAILQKSHAVKGRADAEGWDVDESAYNAIMAA